jgi:hypothetical protein
MADTLASAPNFMAHYGAATHRSGYNILPVIPRDKKPGVFSRGIPDAWSAMQGWTKYCSTRAPDGLIDIWSDWPEAGVGIACGNVVAIDIDILDEELADSVEITVREKLGNTPLIRIGKWPKRLLVYRATSPFSKMRVGPVEVLAEGQFFVAYGVHKDTGSEYAWPDDNPAELPVVLVPPVSEGRVLDALAAVTELLPEELKARPVNPLRGAARSPDGTSSGTSVHGLRAHIEAMVPTIANISNPELHWDDWNNIGMAIYGASNGEDWGFHSFHEWSAQSVKYDPAYTTSRWASFQRTGIHSLGAGTLVMKAQSEGYVAPPEIDFHQGRIDTSDIAAEVEAMFRTQASRK